MNNQLKIFNHQDLGQIRVSSNHDNPLFCLSDICKILEIQNITDIKNSIIREFGQGVDQIYPLKTNGGIQKATFITESQLYFILMRSDKPKAKPFRQWVISEVLPSIRKNGIYATDSTIDKIINDPEFFIDLITKLKNESDRRKQAENKVLILTHTTKTYTITEIAKELGFKSAIALNKKLSDMKIQYFINGTWVMYSKYSDLGYEIIKQDILDSGRIIYHRRITGIGREFILSLFESKEITA